jgi:hypothetical protein
MSPVLFSPALPSDPACIVSLFLNPEFRTALKGFVIDLVKEDIDFRESLREAFDYSVATSELKILKRISTLETSLGFNDLDLDDDDHEPTIPEQIKALSERIEQPLSRPTISIKMDTEIIPQTVTEHRASELITHLKDDIAPRNDEVFLTSREIMTYLRDGIKAEYRIKKTVKNIRQVKKDVIEKAVEMFTTSVSLSKKSNGHKEVRVVLRQSLSASLHTC